jgi:hypothetical protein
VFQVLDPAELTLAFERPTLFQDMETGREVYVDPAAARAGYVEKMTTHLAAVSGICEKLGVAYQRVTTDQPLELALFEFLEHRRRRKTRGRV